jgi:hypothetical protein
MNAKYAPILIALFGLAPVLPAQDLATYEAAIAAPADGGAGPVLWYRDATDIESTHLLNSGSSAGGIPPVEPASATNQAFRLGGVTYDDYFGNAGNAFGIDVSLNASAVAGSTDLFLTGPRATISLLFKTPAVIENTSVFRQVGFELFLLGASQTARLTTEGTHYTSLIRLAPDTWYYFAARWNGDQSLRDDHLTWYMGRLGGTLSFGGVRLAGTGVGATRSIELAGRNTFNKFPAAMQQVAIWTRQLSEQAILQQFDVFQGVTSDLETAVRSVFPAAVEWAPGSITGAWIGDFSTSLGEFPWIEHPSLGRAGVVATSMPGAQLMYLAASQSGNCDQELGWVVVHQAQRQYLYSLALNAWVYLVPNLSGGMWLYDYTTQQWANYAFDCDS